MEESSGTNPEEPERVCAIVPNGRCTTPVRMETATAEDVQKASVGTKVQEYVPVSAKIVLSGEDSIKLLPFGELPQDTNSCSPDPMKLQAENLSGILSSSKQVTADHDHGFNSEMVNNEAMEENNVIATENIDNGLIKNQKSEFDHINMEQKEILPEEVTQNNCLESSTSEIDNQSRNYLLVQTNGDAAKDHIHLEQHIDKATDNAGLEQLDPGQETATEGSSHLEDTVKGTPDLPRNGQISLTSSGGSVKVLPEKRKKNQILPVNSSRSLRSRSQEKSKAPDPSNSRSQEIYKAPDSSNIVREGGVDREKKKRRKKRMEKNKIDEFSRIRKHLRYLLHRIQYEKNLIDAYSGEGWKGQSLEKLKPEKELQRAKSEILRRKLRIRDLFQRLDSLCTEGRIPETLFDSEGEIDSEDIFCAKCGSTDVTLSNDIILCDGACERGFHQFCLDPPLLKEHIPSGDEGWLCPGCDCKVDCLELLNDAQGTNISVTDSWEIVFAEEAAAAAAGKNLDDISGLPSDDSEDDDYNPDGPNLDEKMQEDVSSSDDSGNHSASDDMQVLPQKELFLGLPSDDSEDDDYDPSGLDTDQKAKMESSSSDFTSDSEDFTVVFDECKPSSEVQGPATLSPDHVKSDEEGCGHPVQGDPSSMYPRRQVKRLDYKKLHDEEYGNTSSDSSDEDYMDNASPSTKKNYTVEEDSVSPNLENLTTEHGKATGDLELNQKTSETTQNKRRCIKKFDVDGTNSTPARSRKGSSATSSRSTSRPPFGIQATQRLLQSFKENQYPQRPVKESLATELELSVQQVSKWFENARHSFRHSPRKASEMAKFSSDKGTPSQKRNNLSESEPKSVLDDATSSKGKKKKPDKVTTDKDMTSNMVAEEGIRNTRSTTKTSKRKAKFGSEATEPNTSLETPKQNAEVNPPKTQGVRKSSRIQSKSKESIS